MSNFPCPECGATLRNGARSCGCGWGEKKQIEHKRDYGCAAYGCPLDGAISPSIGPNGTYYCRHHFNTPLHDWAGITASIRSGEVARNEANGTYDYRAYITEKFIKEGLKLVPGNLSQKVTA